MNEQDNRSDDPTPPTLPRKVVPLGYGHESRPARPAGGTTFLRMVVGCVAYIAISAAWFYFGSRLARGSGGVRIEHVWQAWAALTLALLGGALYLRLRYRIAGYGYGILAALGLVFIGIPLLILGLCFLGS